MMNYFQLFNLPTSPAVDESLLAKKYFELQRESHPDFFTQATEVEKEEALKQSADINQAFKILKNKEKTLEYFLRIVGIIEEGEKYTLPPGFLMEMMELNEEISDGEDAISRQKITAIEDELYAGITPLMGQYKKDVTTPAELLRLKEYYYKKKYLNRILDRLGD